MATVAAHCAPDEWTSLDVDADDDLRAMFTAHVPVVWVDGRLLTYWTLSEVQLRQALEVGHWPPPPDL
ncbi:hypothetical protein ACQB6R_12265 [Propionibacteriaceae bacterium G1746]|uniref:hypothetical protein n=1 Tax=Aestuariimicrobium sp. G57 TaxID=3418485 RepID=UPI003C271C39